MPRRKTTAGESPATVAAPTPAEDHTRVDTSVEEPQEDDSPGGEQLSRREKRALRKAQRTAGVPQLQAENAESSSNVAATTRASPPQPSPMVSSSASHAASSSSSLAASLQAALPGRSALCYVPLDQVIAVGRRVVNNAAAGTSDAHPAGLLSFPPLLWNPCKAFLDAPVDLELLASRVRQLQPSAAGGANAGVSQQRKGTGGRACNSRAVRGIRNTPGNACYIAAVLQLLLACPPIAQACVHASIAYRWRRHAVTGSVNPPSRLEEGAMPPLTAAVLGDYALQYWAGARGPLGLPRDLHTLSTVSGRSGSTSFTGTTQEDAPEFLAALLRQIDEDLVRLGVVDVAAAEARESSPSTGGTAGPQRDNEDDAVVGRGWVTVGKGRTKLKQRYESSVGDSFGVGGEAPVAGRGGRGGPLATAVLHGSIAVGTKNAKGVARGVTSIVRDPFIILPVPVVAHQASVPTIADCLRAGLTKEEVDPGDGARVIRRVSQLSDPLPPVLLLQLMRWAVTREGDTVRLSNRVEVGRTLTVPAQAIASVGQRTKSVEYSLLCVVCHEGHHKPSSGHYVAYLPPPAGSPASAPWSVANDAMVQQLDPSVALAQMQPSAYLLCYHRASSQS